jgi:hypothetical protein
MTPAIASEAITAELDEPAERIILSVRAAVAPDELANMRCS